MKIGMIFECVRNGPDQKVCEHLVKMLRPGTEILSVSLGNKPNNPAWGGRKAKSCLHNDRVKILDALAAAGVTSPPAHLVCIHKELEAWLVADGRALAAAISKLIRRSVTVRDVKRPEEEKDPKAKLDRIIRNHCGHSRPYQAHFHAQRIIQELPDLNRIKQCPSFVRFAERAVDVTL
jgi:Domain of unknown function (DUF4276)